MQLVTTVNWPRPISYRAGRRGVRGWSAADRRKMGKPSRRRALARGTRMHTQACRIRRPARPYGMPNVLMNPSRILVHALCLPAVAATLAGCGAPRGDAEAVPHGAPPRVAANARPDSFAASLLRALIDLPAARNAVISPLSAGTALRMVRDGAGGTTRTALDAVLADDDAARGRNESRDGTVQPVIGDGVTLLVANGMWSDEAVAVDPAFVHRLRATYGADVATIDLQGPDAVDSVNAWVAKATRGRIAGMASEPFPESTTLLLTNAIYFKGSWAQAFDVAATSAAPFHLPDGASSAVPMMRREGSFGYARADGFRIARLPYRRDRFAMYVILPDSTVGAKRTPDLSAASLAASIDRIKTQHLQLEIPRFRVEQSIDLRPPLTALGAGIAFDRSRADFSAMYSPAVLGGRRVWVDRAVQKVFVSVNEEGTEAAAATGFGMALDSSTGPIPFVVNRPFYFAVRDDSTGALVILGLIVDPR